MVTESYASRRLRVAHELGAAGLDALLVIGRANLRYLTGFTGSAGAAVVDAAGRGVLAVDDRYAEAAGSLGVPVVTTRRYAQACVDHAQEAGARRVGFEAHVLTVEAHAELVAGSAGVRLTPAGRLIERVRAIKDAGEIEAIRRACRISEQSLTELLGQPLAGRSEREVARELEALFVEGGGDGPAFATIVASGPNSAVPHAVPGERELAAGDLVVLDFGAAVEGYSSDVTRTVYIAGAGETARPAAWQRELYDLVLAGHALARDTLRAGVLSSAVDRTVRDFFAASGHPAGFLHGLGHGIGLDTHEAPVMGVIGWEPMPLAPGMVLAIEPGLYLPGRGGVRIEDDYLIPPGPEMSAGRETLAAARQNEPGAGPAAAEPEFLTTMSRDLLVVP